MLTKQYTKFVLNHFYFPRLNYIWVHREILYLYSQETLMCCKKGSYGPHWEILGPWFHQSFA